MIFSYHFQTSFMRQQGSRFWRISGLRRSKQTSLTAAAGQRWLGAWKRNDDIKQAPAHRLYAGARELTRCIMKWLFFSCIPDDTKNVWKSNDSKKQNDYYYGVAKDGCQTSRINAFWTSEQVKGKHHTHDSYILNIHVPDPLCQG